jgi:hypothetical protein
MKINLDEIKGSYMVRGEYHFSCPHKHTKNVRLTMLPIAAIVNVPGDPDCQYRSKQRRHDDRNP